jgi:hypothetical protein
MLLGIFSLFVVLCYVYWFLMCEYVALWSILGRWHWDIAHGQRRILPIYWLYQNFRSCVICAFDIVGFSQNFIKGYIVYKDND